MKTKTMNQTDLETVSDHIRNYTVTGLYCGLKTTIKIHVGLSSKNHFKTIKELAAKEGITSISEIRMNTTPTKKSFSIHL